MNFTRILFERFGSNSNFDECFIAIDLDQDGNYTVFGVFGELISDLLNKRIKDEKLLIQSIEFIDEILRSKDSEWENIVKSEILSILNKNELIKVKVLLSKETHHFVEFYM